jgi:hypothetical protein
MHAATVLHVLKLIGKFVSSLCGNEKLVRGRMAHAYHIYSEIKFNIGIERSMSVICISSPYIMPFAKTDTKRKGNLLL